MMAALGLAPPAMANGAVLKAGILHPELHAAMTRMERGEPSTVVFFGGSITWGATATDPLRTSWRARVEREMRRRHPRTPLTCVDAAIGGQPSRLGVFRMDRDVLPYQPDLCFVEFAVNDWGAADSQETIEGIIRKLRAFRSDMAIVLVLIGSNAAYDRSPSHPLQVALAEHYGLPVIDIYSAVKTRLDQGLTTREILTDGCHPNDQGYQLYADIVIEQLDALRVATGEPGEPPFAPLTANRYESARMVPLVGLEQGSGWEAGIPSVVGTWFDHTPSRWHDSSVRATREDAALSVDLDVTGVGLYFELVPDGKPLVVQVDGTEHLALQTLNRQPFARVQYAFRFLETPGSHRLSLLAPEGGPATAAYFLITGDK